MALPLLLCISSQHISYPVSLYEPSGLLFDHHRQVRKKTLSRRTWIWQYLYHLSSILVAP